MTRARAVLGVDAAWTEHNPSGVALCVETAGGWVCAGLAPSYEAFEAIGRGVEVDWFHTAARGSVPDSSALLATCKTLAPEAEVVAIAIDAPLAQGPIQGRREADRLVSVEFGAKHCSTHSPTEGRPGKVSETLRNGFAAEGFPLITAGQAPGGKSLLEAYPHVALLSLCSAASRLPYKIARAARYWPQLTTAERRERLLFEWRAILAVLEKVIEVNLPLPEIGAAPTAMKRYEDALDALVCAWMAIDFIQGNARPLGNAQAAIWVPR